MLHNLFGDKTFWKSMLTLAIPIAIQNLLTSSFTLVDTLMISQLGDVSLAAVGIAAQWSWLLNMVIFGICSGAAVFFSQYHGDGNRKGIIHTYGIALIFGMMFAVLFMAIGFFAPHLVIGAFNRNPAVLNEGVSYLKIAVFSYPAILMNLLINNVLRSTERVKLPMFVAFFTTILNAFLDYGLIFGAFGLPKLGIEGAAIATVISAWSGPLIILIICAIKKDDIFFAPIVELLGFDKAFSILFIKRAFPVILNETLWGLGTVVYTVIFSNMGYEYTAAVSILRTFENIALSFFIGMINASSVIVGRDIGCGEIKEATKNSVRYMIIVPLTGLIVGLFVVIFRDPLISIFNTSENISRITLESARHIMLIYALELAFRNVPYIAIVGIFRSGGDTKKGMKYDLITLWLISVPITTIAAFVFKLPFPVVFACSYMCEDYIKAFLCIRYFKSNKWIKPVTDTGQKALEEFLKDKKLLANK
ncbi:MAG: MATE family efflux transporter [Ruminococcaceae bacterium]|nr:MATE family efflux transporter [Oscillospiraceae bacterium]